MVMMLSAVLAMASLQNPSACIDPATPLPALALQYATWTGGDAELTAALNSARTFFNTQDVAAYRTAVHALDKIARERKESVQIQLTLGLLYASGPEIAPHGSTGYRNAMMDGSGMADNLAARNLEKALKLDPSQWLAAVALTHIALATHEKGRTEDALRSIAAISRNQPKNVTLLLARYDLLTAQNRLADARATLGSGSATACTGLMHARAEARILAGEVPGGSAYLDALTSADSMALDRFYDDARIVLTGEEVTSYMSLPVSDRRAWLVGFWERSAAKSGITPAARVAEQVRRAAYAQLHYRRAKTQVPGLERGAGADPNSMGRDGYSITSVVPDVMISNPTPWDDRGVIYVRQGEPDTIVRSLEGILTRIPDNQIWVYEKDTPAWVFPFIRTLGPEWFFSPSIGCGSQQPRASLAQSNNAARLEVSRKAPSGFSEAREFYLLLAGFNPMFYKLAGYCGLGSVGGGNASQFRNANRELAQYYRPLMADVTHSESAAPKFRNRMRILLAAYAFRDAAGRPELTALSWIPAKDLRDSIPTNRLNLTYTLVDPKSAPLRHDTTIIVPPSQGDGMLRTAKTWRGVPFSSARLLVVAMDADNNAHGISKGVNVTLASAAPRLALSDLVVGEPGKNGLLERGNVHISPLPDHAIANGSEFRLYFEMYGIGAGDSLATTIRITRNEQKSIAELLRLYPGRRESREITFSSKADLNVRGIATQDVAIGTTDLLPGEYTIEAIINTRIGELRNSTKLIIEAPPRPRK